MSIYTPPFRSDIFYAIQNEDYQTEIAVIQRLKREELRVLMIASSGENVLSVLAQPGVSVVYAVDINPAQLHLCDLRCVATEYLTSEEQLRLLGARSASPDGAAERVALYERVRPYLTADARRFWDDRRSHEIAFGVQHTGRNDVAMQDIRAATQSAGFAPLERALHDSELPDWKAIYETLMTPQYIQDLFGLSSQVLADRIAGIAGYLGECHFRALQQPTAARNPFVTTVFRGTYPDTGSDDDVPVYLQPEAQRALRGGKMAHHLHLYAGSILDWMPRLATDAGTFDLISISNIADWMTEGEFEAVTVLTRQNLKPGGTLLARTATTRRMIEDVMEANLAVDRQFNAHLERCERGPWFRIISAGFKP